MIAQQDAGNRLPRIRMLHENDPWFDDEGLSGNISPGDDCRQGDVDLDGERQLVVLLKTLVIVSQGASEPRHSRPSRDATTRTSRCRPRRGEFS